jgi:hypothetical protein
VDNETYIISPEGPYQIGDVVTVNYTLGSFYQLNTNWVIAFQINLGEGWTDLNPTSAPININTNSVLGNGYWSWDSQNTFTSGLEFGPGFRFVNLSWDDYWWQQGSPNWGSSSTGPLSFSFDVTVAETCTPDDLLISINVYGDCLTGGWDNGDCCADSALVIYDGTVFIPSALNSGSDTSVVYCQESSNFNLFDLLGDDVQNDGFWTPSLAQGYLGQFNPSLNTQQEYVYTVSDECNTESSSVFLSLDNSESQPTVELQLCDNDTIVSLYSALNLNNTSGVWQGTSSLSSGYQGFFNPQEQQLGLYTYTVLNENDCQQSYPLDVSIIEENINAGSDYVLEICIDDPGVNFYELIGNPDINGVWSPSLNANYLGFFNPSANLSGDYTYTLTGECDTYQSQVNVNVIEVLPPPIVAN